jgi:hypothetical protein
MPEVTHDNLSLDMWSEAIMHQGSAEDLPILHVCIKKMLDIVLTVLCLIL